MPCRTLCSQPTSAPAQGEERGGEDRVTHTHAEVDEAVALTVRDCIALSGSSLSCSRVIT